MKSNYKIAAAVIGSFVLGVGAASVLHAQTKPLGYVLAEIDVKDQDGYTKEFLPKAQANIKESAANTRRRLQQSNRLERSPACQSRSTPAIR